MPVEIPNIPSLIAHLRRGNALVLVRNGNVADGSLMDPAGDLTDRGAAQAAGTRRHLAKNYAATDMVACSTRACAINTLLREDAVWGWPIPLGELTLSSEDTYGASVIQQAFARLGYAPLSGYFADPVVQSALLLWAKQAALALETAFEQHNLGRGAVLVGGHVILLNALAIMIAKALDREADISVALESALGEAECIEIRVVDGIVRMRHLTAIELEHPTAA